MSNPAEKSVHIVFGGGGVRCIAYVGALATLVEKGYRIASISACSAGTIIAALVCTGLSISRIEKLILETDLKRFENQRFWLASLNMFLRWPHALYKRSRASEMVCEWLEADPKLSDLPIPFATIGVDLVTNSFVIFSAESEPEMRISEAISIATAVPFAFPPYQKGGRIVVDASVATQCPVWLTALQNTNLPIFSFTCPNERSVETPENFGAYLEPVPLRRDFDLRMLCLV